ncbi:MAG: SUMF1/EgtB/PvdO family nonheme iron enzyme [Planctomycetes bacterium]|nr:SUMF1/EgtB/PvdO family nonheme iron enzyme [Planctomycetota bacterium]
MRLAVAAHGRFVPEELRHATLGHWVRALAAGSASITDTALLEALQLFREAGFDAVGAPRSTTARELFDALVAYRNRVIGHGSARDEAFYARAARKLIDGLDAAWEQGLFLEPGSHLGYSESVFVDRDGARRVRWLDLSSETPIVEEPLGSPAADDILPRRLYLRSKCRARALHPWLVYEERRERLWCFQSFTRRAEFIDYASGEVLRGQQLEAELAGLHAEVTGLFANVTTAPTTRSDVEESGSESFAGFRLLGKLGEGGMGTVHLARQESLGRLVALKRLGAHARRDALAMARFQREIEALARCEHPNVVKILASGEHEGVLYYAMEYVEGADLGRVGTALSKTGDLPRAVSSAWQEARTEEREHPDQPLRIPERPIDLPASGDRFRDCARLFRDAVLAVQHLHERGIVHRDISPANVRVSMPHGRAMVMDLGLAMLEGAQLSLTRDRGHLLGTLRYMSPEQLQRNLLSVDRRTDVYSLGAVLYELLSGRAFHDGDTEARLIEQILRREPVPLETMVAGVPRELATIVRKATDKDPALRYESAQALADDLQAFLERRPISAVPPTPLYVLRKWLDRNRKLAASYALLVVVVLAGSWVSVREVRARLRVEADRERARVAEDVRTCVELRAEAEALWPAVLETAPRMRAWLERARVLAERGPVFVEREAALRSRATADPVSESDPDSPQTRTIRELAARTTELRAALAARPEAAAAEFEALAAQDAALARLRAELQANPRLRFEDDRDRVEHERLVELIAALRGLSGPAEATGSIANITQRLERIQRAPPRDTRAEEEAWALARAALQDRARTPLYEGLLLRTQTGLLPLGSDPRSGLWEFAVLGTGVVPSRSTGGELQREPDAAIVLVLLPGARFTMGEDASLDELPKEEAERIRRANRAWPHLVALDPYFIAKHELTQAQWSALTGKNPSTYGPGRGGADDHPVESVTWDEAVAALSRVGLVLPTEAQWEYAARAGKATAWWTGDSIHELGRAGNIADAALWRAHPDRTIDHERSVDDGQSIPCSVGSFDPNAFGLHDTVGNVSEWCRDAHASYSEPVRAEDGERLGGDAGLRALRGGGWDGGPDYARSTQRVFNAPSARLQFVGVRPARALER